jgi:transketolase
MTDPDNAAKAPALASAKAGDGSASLAGPVRARAVINSPPRGSAPIDQLCINTIRTLTMDAVQQAGSAHPEMPIASSPVVYTLWQRFLRFDPTHPLWPNRDRFVLSSGPASILLHALLHLTGTRAIDATGQCLDRLAVSLDDISHVGALDSHRPAHLEHGLTTNVEAIAGPLGQQHATSVGMAIAERWLAAHFNRPKFALFDYDIYAMLGDGDMMEGVAGETAARAGQLMLGNLCWIYHSSRITQGHADLAFSDDVAARFLAFGWNVQKVSDANDTGRIAQAIEAFGRVHDVPTLIVIESNVGSAIPDKHDALGQPDGEEESRLAKRSYGWPEDANLQVPEGVREHFDASIGQRGRRLQAAWTARLAAYRTQYPALAEEIDRMQARGPPGDGEQARTDLTGESKALRDAVRPPRR